MVSSFLFSSKILAFLRVATDFVLKIRKFFFSTFPPSYFRNMLICCLVASKMVVVVFSNPLISLFMLEHKILYRRRFCCLFTTFVFIKFVALFWADSLWKRLFRCRFHISSNFSYHISFEFQIEIWFLRRVIHKSHSLENCDPYCRLFFQE